MMNMPDSFHVAGGYACYRPVKHVSLDEATEMICTAITCARENLITRLLVDVTQLTGFPPPTTLERFRMACRAAGVGGTYVKIAVVARAEYIDPEKFGALVAQNLGVRAEAFTSADQAMTWLMSHRTARLSTGGGRG